MVLSYLIVLFLLKTESSAVHTLHKHSTTDPEISPLFYILFLYTSKIIPYLFTHPVYEFFVHAQHACLVLREARRRYWNPWKWSWPTSGCWELSLSPLLEHLVLLIAEPSLQPPNNIFNIYSWETKDVDHVKKIATLLCVT